MLEEKTKYYKNLDTEIKNQNIFKKTGRTIVTLTHDGPFKAFFGRNPDYLKEFLILETNLNLNPNEVSITFDSEEFPIENKTGRGYRVDILVYLNDNIIANVEANGKKYDDIMYRNLIYMAKLTGNSLLKKGEKTDNLKKMKLLQLNINTNEKDNKFGEDILKLEGKHIKAKNFQVMIKNVAYYRKLYYNKAKLNKADLWLVFLSSKTYSEAYEVLCQMYDDENHINQIMEEVIKLNRNKKILTNWEAQMLEDLANYTEKENAIKEGREQGIKEGIKEGKLEQKIETVKNLLKENIDINIISKVTGLSLKEIENLK